MSTSGTKMLAYNKRASGLQLGPLIQRRVEFQNVWHGRYYQEMKKDELLVCMIDFQEMTRGDELHVEQEASKGLMPLIPAPL